MKKRSQTTSEIDIIHKLSQKMTADELERYYKSRFADDLLYFKRIVMEEKERIDEAKNLPFLAPLIEKVNLFFSDLVTDGYIIKNIPTSFRSNSRELYGLSQQREEAHSILCELSKGTEKTHKEAIRKWNRLYAILYETVLGLEIISLAQKIYGKKIFGKSKALEVLNSYRGGKHRDVFKSLIPQIRNSIQHRDFVIAPTKPEITFNDRDKPPLVLSMDEFYEKVTELLDLSMVLDVASFYLDYPIWKVLIESIDTVYEYGKQNKVRFFFGENAPLTLLDWASLIKSKAKLRQ